MLVARSALRGVVRPIARRSLCDSLDAELGLRRSLTKKLVSQRRQPPPPPSRAVPGPVARVSTVALREGAAGELCELYSSSAKALYSECPGFLGSVLLLDREANTARSVTMWQASSDMDAAGEHPDYASVMGKLAASFASAPDSQTWQLGAAFFCEGKALEKALTSTSESS